MKITILQELYRLLQKHDINIPDIGYKEIRHKSRMFKDYDLMDLINNKDHYLSIIIPIEEIYDIHIDEPGNIGCIVNSIEETMI